MIPKPHNLVIYTGPKMWSDMLKLCREKNKEELARLGEQFEPVEGQAVVKDHELIDQIASLGAFDHPLYKQLIREAYQRWGK